MKQALLIIDVQNDYFPQGKKPLFQPEKALANINRLEQYFISHQQPILYIQHIKNKPHPDFFEAGTNGVLLHPKLNCQSDSLVIEKHYPNSFLETTLTQTLQQFEIEQLVITGMMTHMCVDSTTRAAAEFGYKPILIADATATCDLVWQGQLTSAPQVQTAYLAALQNFSTVINTEQFINI